ncbi:MAG TPA: ATP-binding protein [Kofleriaceae bacterium]|nr:ATP-binding protein [Kofleriaceae bacterium]
MAAVFGEELVERLPAGVVGVRADLTIAVWNAFMAAHTAIPAAAALGRGLLEVCPGADWLAARVGEVFARGVPVRSSWRERPHLFAMAIQQDVTLLLVGELVAIVVSDASDAAIAELALEGAREALDRGHAEHLQLEVQLRLAHRLEAIGQLAAGVAHELNTPMQFVSDSLQFVLDSAGELIAALDQLPPDTAAALDLAFVTEQVPLALRRAQSGLERMTKIVRALNSFSHPDHGRASPVDLNRAIESTLTLARSEYKYVAELDVALGELPSVTCVAGEINQVVLNLVVNAAQAIGDAVGGSGRRGTITVRSRRVEDHVEIAIGDTGSGIPAAIADRVFDPFFSTRQTGKGTGLGLAVARTVVDRHRGRMWFDTGAAGTTFYVRLPIG